MARKVVTNDQRSMAHSASHAREFEIVLVWAIDRLGRSIQHLVGFMNEIQALGIFLTFTAISKR